MNAILVYLPSDSDWDLALDRARELAERSGARVTLADIVSPHASPGRAEAVRQRLEAFAGPLRRSGVSVDVTVGRGRPAAELTRMAVEREHDLVLKSARPDDAEGTAAFGSVARQLLRLCPVPVWVLRHAPARSPRAVLAAVDPGADAAGADAERGDHLASRVLRQAHRIATLEGAELHLVHAWRPYGEDTLGSPMLGVPDEQRRAYEVRAGREASRDLIELLRIDAELVAGARIHFHKGDALQVISNAALRVGADVIVMGTVARRGMAGVVVGNTVERVMRVTQTSILAVKPEGFVSPLLRASPKTAA